MGKRKTGVSTRELVDLHASKLIEFRDGGRTYREIAYILSEQTKKTVTEGVVKRACKELGLMTRDRPKTIDISEEDVEDEEPIEDLIDRRIEASARKMKKHKRHNRVLRMKSDPFALLVLGDPHVDNDGCDWSRLFADVRRAQKEEGVLAACVGDMQDNWIGRLARMYAESTIKASDGWRLSKWLLESLQWVAIVGGNHDSWAHSAGVDPLGWIAKEAGVKCYAPDELRITFEWSDAPDLEPVVWILRHDFRGRSWFHPTHGAHKEAMLDGRAHIFTAGHIHQWGQLTTEQRHKRVTHAIRVRGYKRCDAYAVEKGFYEQQYGEACLIVIDPKCDGAGRISVHWNLEAGYDRLRLLRSRM